MTEHKIKEGDEFLCLGIFMCHAKYYCGIVFKRERHHIIIKDSVNICPAELRGALNGR